MQTNRNTRRHTKPHTSTDTRRKGETLAECPKTSHREKQTPRGATGCNQDRPHQESRKGSHRFSLSHEGIRRTRTASGDPNEESTATAAELQTGEDRTRTEPGDRVSRNPEQIRKGVQPVGGVCFCFAGCGILPKFCRSWATSADGGGV